jgi:predicted RNA-binding protein with RPS1 domain
LTFANQFEPTNPVETSSVELETKPETASSTSAAPTDAKPPAEEPAQETNGSRRKILIGSQRDPAAYRVRPRHDLAPLEPRPKRHKKKGERGEKRGERREKAESGERNTDGVVCMSVSQGLVSPAASVSTFEFGVSAAVVDPPAEIALGGAPLANFVPPAADAKPQAEVLDIPNPTAQIPNPETENLQISKSPNLQISSPTLIDQLASALAKTEIAMPKPSVRDRFTPDMEEELALAMGGVSLDDLMGGESAAEEPFESGSTQSGRVIAVRRDDVFVEFSANRQGVLPLRLFDVPPRVGQPIQAIIERLNPDDGLYELSLPNKAVQVDDWSDLIEGALVEVRVTGHNAGGLECEVNHIRGFIPVSQIDLYRVEDMAQYVDQRLTCVITEANPDRRNLVLSRRAVLEREREQARQQMLDSLKPGDVREGVVRKIMDFGAFVELGSGVDGLLHVSQLAWGRVKHPSDVLKEGQQIKVRVEKVDPDSGRISLTHRDLLENPWTTAAQKYPPQSVVTGTVVKLMDFGAFVEVEPGVEGLVHISELSHKRVWRCSDVVKEGQQVEAMVKSVDVAAQRMSLSMKELSAPPEPVKKEEETPAEAAKPAKKKHQKPAGPLLGGLGRSTGDRFGLKW